MAKVVHCPSTRSNRGVGGNRNHAVALSKGMHLIFRNTISDPPTVGPDTSLTPWLMPIANPTQSIPDALPEESFASELTTLQRLLLGDRLDALDEMVDYLGDRQRRAEELAELLPAAVRHANAQHEELPLALQEPIESAIRTTIHRDIRVFADLLYPVMGPAVRRSVGESLRAFVESINQAIEQSLSAQGLRWRWEAMRSGVPFAEVVLKHTLIYRVEQVFLIQRRSGLLIYHLSHPEIQPLDSEAVSAMLTAIGDFVHDAFTSAEEESELGGVDMGADKRVWLIHGPEAMLACVIRGFPTQTLREQLEELLERLHRDLGVRLARFDGDRQQLPEPQSLLGPALSLAYRDSPQQKRRGNPFLAPPFLIIALLLLGGLSSLGYHLWRQERQWSGFLDRLQQQPGWVITDARPGEPVIIRGLRDPLALSPASIEAPYPEIDYRLVPFHSLEPDLVLARAQRLLGTPLQVTLQLDGERLIASGIAPISWRRRAELQAPLLPGIATLDTSSLELELDDATLLARLRETLDPPEGIQLTVKNKIGHVQGRAGLLWVESLQQADIAALGLERLDQGTIELEEQLELNRLSESLPQRPLLFNLYLWEIADSELRLRGLARDARRAIALADQLDIPALLLARGDSDGTGTPEQNAGLRQRRAELLRNALIEAGVPPQRIEARPMRREARPGLPDPSRRRAVLELILGERDGEAGDNPGLLNAKPEGGGA